MPNTSDEGLSQDTMFDLLSNPRRRFILQYLNRTEETITLQDLATEVAAWENEMDPDELTDKQQKRLYVSLYQTHIPKLEKSGVIDYGEDTGEIRLTNQAHDLDVYLNGDTATSDSRPWQWYYLLLAVAGVLVYGLIALGALPVDRFGTVLGVGLIILLAVPAGVHYLDARRKNET